MAEIRRGNWSMQDPGDDIPDGSIIYGGNFSQAEPDTPIMVGKTLTILGGTFINVLFDENWTFPEGHQVSFARISRCTNLAPGLTTHGVAACEENCDHVVDAVEIEVDGEVIDTIYSYKDTVL